MAGELHSGKKTSAFAAFFHLSAFLMAFAGSAPAHALELLVSGFGSDAVGRYSFPDGAHLGALTGGTLDGPQAVILGPDNRLYVANEGQDSVERYNPRTLEFIDIFISAGSGVLDGPTGLAFGPDGNLYVASFENSSVLRYDGVTGAFLSIFVSTGSGGLSGPDVGLTFGPDGNLYVPSFFNNRIIRYDGATGGSPTTLVAGLPAQLTQPRVILFRDGLMYVTCDNGNKVMRYNATTGALVDTFVAAGSGGLNGASGMVFGPDGNLYVSSWRNDRVLRFSGTTGAYINDVFSAAAGGLDGPTFLFLLQDVAVPTVSEWGLLVLVIVTLTAGSLILQRASTPGHATVARCN